MNQYSDSESHDSDEGIRYKTDSTRFKQDKNVSSSRRGRSKSRSPRNKFRRRSRSRSKSRSPKNKLRRKDSKRSRSRSGRNRSKSPRNRSRSPRNRSRSPRKRSKREKSNSEDSLRNKSFEGPKLPSHQSRKVVSSPISLQSSSRLKKVEMRVDFSHIESPEVLEKHKGGGYLGSQLPFHLENKNEGPHEESATDSSSIGPQLPSYHHEEKKSFGPPLPPHLKKKEDIGPQLPPHLVKSGEEKETSSYAGPQLPPHFLKKEEASEESSCIGPQLPPHLRQKLKESSQQEESDDETYGPLPADALIHSKAQVALEERALQLKMDQLEPNKDKAPVREDWMLELPDAKRASFGLGPRQFRSKGGPDMSDRSSWTDTPDKKTKNDKVDLKKEAEAKEIRKRDEEQEKVAKKLKKKSKESLLVMHQTKMKQKKKEEGPTERRPFSRETDLQVNRFDEAQKKAVLKKAQLLDDRFSSGQSKFL